MPKIKSKIPHDEVVQMYGEGYEIAELASQGYMNTVIYIFRSKNFYGMQDQAKVEITTKTDYRSENESLDQIAHRYAIPAEYTEKK